MRWYNLIWSLSSWAHLSGSFMLTTIAIRFLGVPVAIAGMILFSIALEAYQWQYQPDYELKRADTVLDLIADGIGIGLGVMV